MVLTTTGNCRAIRPLKHLPLQSDVKGTINTWIGLILLCAVGKEHDAHFKRVSSKAARKMDRNSESYTKQMNDAIQYFDKLIYYSANFGNQLLYSETCPHWLMLRNSGHFQSPSKNVIEFPSARISPFQHENVLVSQAHTHTRIYLSKYKFKQKLSLPETFRTVHVRAIGKTSDWLRLEKYDKRRRIDGMFAGIANLILISFFRLLRRD